MKMQQNDYGTDVKVVWKRQEVDLFASVLYIIFVSLVLFCLLPS